MGQILDWGESRLLVLKLTNFANHGWKYHNPGSHQFLQLLIFFYYIWSLIFALLRFNMKTYIFRSTQLTLYCLDLLIFLFNLTLLCSSSPHDCVIFHCKNLELVPDQMIYVLVMKIFFCGKAGPLECKNVWRGQAYILSGKCVGLFNNMSKHGKE